MSNQSTYVLGINLSHDGSACLLKDGKIAIAIEKERLTHRKHDGKNDNDAVRYCLEAEKIKFENLTLIVQNQNFSMLNSGSDQFPRGVSRLIGEGCGVPIVTISHHLAHAYNAVGTGPFEEMAILVLDGCGNAYDDVIEKAIDIYPRDVDPDLQHLFFEKDSFYHFREELLTPLVKDFSPGGMNFKDNVLFPPTTKHSIGGLYSAVKEYCFGGTSDEGKLMGLAPYGRADVYKEPIFDLIDGRVFVRYNWMSHFRKPCLSHDQFKKEFQYYADIAQWTQKEIERALVYLVTHRRRLTTSNNLAFTGGVALNAVANAILEKESGFDNIYFTPAAGDNGVAIGCAFYGWCRVLGQRRAPHNGSSCFGRCYSREFIRGILDNFVIPNAEKSRELVPEITTIIAESMQAHSGKRMTIGLNVVDAGIFTLFLDEAGGKIDHSAPIYSDLSLYCSAEQLIRWINSGNHLAVKNREFFDYKGDIHSLMTALNLSEVQRRLRILFETRRICDCIPVTKEPRDLCQYAAKLLVKGKVLGWFQAGSEFGPRALGRRSILADPGRTGLRDFINRNIKFREDFRPFAPSVLYEDVSEYFEYERESPYMIVVARVKPRWAQRLQNVVHCDGSSRIQTVTKEWNGRFYELLRAYKQASGISVLLNTSFNRRGMPIVETPSDAMGFFYECGLDALVIGDFLVEKQSPNRLSCGGRQAVGRKSAVGQPRRQ